MIPFCFWLIIKFRIFLQRGDLIHWLDNAAISNHTKCTIQLILGSIKRKIIRNSYNSYSVSCLALFSIWSSNIHLQASNSFTRPLHTRNLQRHMDQCMLFSALQILQHLTDLLLLNAVYLIQKFFNCYFLG